MKSNILLFLFCALFSVFVFAQSPAPNPSPSASPIASPSPAASNAAPAAASVAPVIPAWVNEVLTIAEGLPVVGPILVNAAMYAGILASLLTALVAILLSSSTALSKMAGLAGLSGVATWLANFQSGKFMYYLQFLSMFNAKKPASPSDSSASAAVKQAA